MLKRVIITLTLTASVISFSFAQSISDFEPEYDPITHCINNWSDWERKCAEENRDPVFEEYLQHVESIKMDYDGHCDFELLEKLGIDEAEVLDELMGVNK